MKLNKTEKFILKGDTNANGHLYGYADTFVQAILKLTNSETVQEAFSKVKPVYDFAQGETHCICEKNIYWQFFVQNIENDEIYTIGSECINKFYRAEMTHSEEWENFIDYANAVQKLQKRVMSVLKTPKKLWTLNRGKFIELMTQAKLDHLIPLGFEDTDKPLLFVKLDNYLLIKELTKLFSINKQIIENFKDTLRSEETTNRDKDAYLIWNCIKKNNNTDKILEDITAVKKDRCDYTIFRIKSKSKLNYERIRYLDSSYLYYMSYILQKNLKKQPHQVII